MRWLPFDKPVVKGSEQPEQLLVAGGWRRVEEVVDHWRETGRWWAGESPRDFFLVEAKRGAFIVSKGPAGWQIERLID